MLTFARSPLQVPTCSPLHAHHYRYWCAHFCRLTTTGTDMLTFAHSPLQVPTCSPLHALAVNRRPICRREMDSLATEAGCECCHWKLIFQDSVLLAQPQSNTNSVRLRYTVLQKNWAVHSVRSIHEKLLLIFCNVKTARQWSRQHWPIRKSAKVNVRISIRVTVSVKVS